MKRTILCVSAGLFAVLGFAVLRWSQVNSWSTARQLHAATTDEERQHAADALVALGEAGQQPINEAFHSEEEAVCAAVVQALAVRFDQLEPSSPEYRGRCESISKDFASFSETGKAALLDLVPILQQSGMPEQATIIPEIAKAALKHSSPEKRITAIRLAAKSEVVPLLRDNDVSVRRAAMLAVGPRLEGEAPVISTEELFHWLHDEDAQVRDYCESALLTRDLDAVQVRLARLLSHPDPTERLKLLTELQSGGDSIRDAGPWLERLSHDAEPAIRLGAARVAFEMRLQFAAWLDRLAGEDADLTVRRGASYYRDLVTNVRQTRFEQ